MSAALADSKTNARSQFLELHQHWTERAEAQAQLKLLPAQKKGRDNELAKKAAALEADRLALKRLKMEADKLELNLKTNDQRNRDLVAKLNQCRAPKEYEALQHEIAGVKADTSKTEEQIFAMIAEQEAKAEAIAAADKALAVAKEEFVKFAELIEYKIQKMKDRVGILDARIAEIEKAMDADLATQYRRLTAFKGALAIAPCENGYCQSCNIEQTPQARAELGADKIVQCSTCAALLYRA